MRKIQIAALSISIAALFGCGMIQMQPMQESVVCSLSQQQAYDACTKILSELGLTVVSAQEPSVIYAEHADNMGGGENVTVGFSPISDSSTQVTVQSLPKNMWIAGGPNWTPVILQRLQGYSAGGNETADNVSSSSGSGKPEIGILIQDFEGGGAYVYEVKKGSAAEMAGVRVGDVILQINGQIAYTAEEAANHMRVLKPGGVAVLGMARYDAGYGTWVPGNLTISVPAVQKEIVKKLPESEQTDPNDALPEHTEKKKDTEPPTIVMIEPPDEQSKRGIAIVPKAKTVKIAGVAKDASEIISILVAGKDAETKKVEGGLFFQKEIDVSGEEEVLVQATDASGNVATRKFRFSASKQPEAAATQIPRMFVFLVGVSKYKDESLCLKYADKDAEALGDFFLNNKSMADMKDNVVVLLNENATRENIIKQLKTLLMKTFAEDFVFVFFAMHGVPEESELYFLPHDASMDNLEGTAFGQEEISRLLKKCRAGKVLLTFDACHAGGFGDKFAFTRGNYEQQTNNLLSEMGKIKPGMSCLSAASAAESSLEEQNLGHGVFTNYLLKGLKGEADGFGGNAADGFVRLRELFDYTYRKVAEHTGNKQHPVISGDLDGSLPLNKVDK